MPRLILLFFLLFFSFTVPLEANTVVLSNEVGTVACDVATLRIEFKDGEGEAVLLSGAQDGLGSVAGLETTPTQARWSYPERDIQLRLDRGQVHVHIATKTVGEFTFPLLVETPVTAGWILPLFEGVYVPSGDKRWNSFLAERGEMNTTADLTMPFLGLHLGDRTLTCLLTNPFNNTLRFRARDSRLEAGVTHEFTRNQAVKEYGVIFEFGDASPIAPAMIYRKWLKERGDFVSLREKIQLTPETEKLLGAAHVYVWGEDLMSQADVRDWKKFAKALQSGAGEEHASPSKRIWSLLDATAREAATNIVNAEWPDRYTKSLVTTGLNKLLIDPDFYDEETWGDLDLTGHLPGKERSQWTPAEVVRLNSHLLFTSFPKLLAPVDDWGSGVSPKMMHELAAAGLDRLWIGSGSWQGFVRRPETVSTAKALGFLVGPYDSYHSMHHPDETDSWETAQFGAELYRTGAIVNADGSKRHGFKKKGFLLSPIAARPHVESRLNGLMKQFRANSWFIDCDGFGEYFDDYSPEHPATQLSDMLARLDRMAWIRDRFDVVVGTEGCSAGVASTVHFAHGVMTPVIGWGDPDLNDKESKYYLGAYYPPQEPAVFFKSTPIKEQYRYHYYDPRFRLPLFQTVFHDSVIATHHWSNPSLKFPGVADQMQLLELLYNVPPLYHLNPSVFQKQQATIKRHYDFFSPLHRKLALLPLTGFEWLNNERTVQSVTFGDAARVVANFSDQPIPLEKISIPARSLAVTWVKTGETMIYSPE